MDGQASKILRRIDGVKPENSSRTLYLFREAIPFNLGGLYGACWPWSVVYAGKLSRIRVNSWPA